jgi:hypothetical protein
VKSPFNRAKICYHATVPLHKIFRPIVALFLTLLAVAGFATPVKYFTPGQGQWSVNGISRDGTTVVGECFYPDAFTLTPFKYNVATSTFTPFTTSGEGGAYGASNNGAVVVGAVDFGKGFYSDGTLTEVLHTEGFTGVSDNGVVAVGEGENGDAISWTRAGGIHILAYAYHPSAGLTYSINGNACSTDGNVIVGDSFDASFNAHPTIWAGGSQLQLPIPSGFTGGAAYAVSADGTWVAGNYYTGGAFTEERGFIYHNGQTTMFASPANSGVGFVYSISNDGSVVLGRGYDAQGNDEDYFVHTPAGSVNYMTYLTDNGVVFDNTLQYGDCSSMSGDGLRFTGTWYNNAKFTSGNWVATITPPKLTKLTVNPAGIVGGNSVTGTVTVDASTGATVTLSSNNAAALPPATVKILKGSLTASFTVPTTGVASAVTATIKGTLFGSTASAPLIVNAASFTNLVLNATTVVGGNTVSGLLGFNGKPPSAGAVVSLSSTNTAAATVPATVTAPGTSTTCPITVTTLGVAANTVVSINATYHGITKSATLTVTPATLLSLSAATTVVGGNYISVKALLNGKAPVGGFALTWHTYNPGAIPIANTTLPVPAGATSVSQTLLAYGVDYAINVVLQVTHGSVTKQATVLMKPAALNALTCTVTSVASGSSFVLVAHMNGYAGPSGLKVTMTSSDPTHAPVPASVLVFHNTLAKSFTVVTTKVSVATQVTFTATPPSGPSYQCKVTLNP